MCATGSQAPHDENNKFVSILCPKWVQMSYLLILIGKNMAHELTYDSIIALQHYFGKSNNFFNRVLA